MGLAREHFTLFLRAFKLEQELEVWVSAGEEKAFQLLVTYPICKNSGHLGPKRKEGDLQVPEGCYLIDRMNPNSSYHLSMGLNYPNASDLIRGDQQEPGSDIFIHGGCVTVGCLPITNPKIEELYQLVTQAQSNGQEQVPVHIFPARMRQDFTPVIRDSPHSLFWAELLPIYEYFEQNRQLPKVKIDATGAYSL
ncbi:MAG: L,D-transpeptidase family protein [Saprospiraceae bacterium]|nr:L,D-transpeptidase family protein [Saprospiraceae bacterium]